MLKGVEANWRDTFELRQEDAYSQGMAALDNPKRTDLRTHTTDRDQMSCCRHEGSSDAIR